MLFLLAPSPASLDAILDDPKLVGAVVSASVTTLDGKIVYERNPGFHMTPASNQKLLSNAYALWKLGPAYRPVTRFWKRDRKLIVDSPGDPLLGYNDLIAMRRRLKPSPETVVNLHQAYWPGIPNGWEWDDLPNKYAAPITAFTVNQGAFELWNHDGKVVGVPSLFGNRLTVRLSHEPVKLSYDPILKQISVEGRLPKGDSRLDTLAFSQPDVQAAKLLGRGLTYVSSVPTVSPDATITGKTVAELVNACLPPSDNNIAENLLLMAATKGQPATRDPYPLAKKSLAAFMSSVVGAPEGDIHPEDGSGMSRHNFVTTRALTRLLCWADAQPTSAIWRNALVTPGEGTMKNRLSGVHFQGKTGTLDMVVALSGYVRRASGQDLVVSIIINQFGGSTGEARNLADQFVSEVANVELNPETN